jgi:hypothetical protein
VQEFGFEVSLCAQLEDADHIVARQLGAHVHGRRIVDTVVLEPGPNFQARTAITAEAIPDALVKSDIGPGRARYVGDVLGDVHPERRADLIEAGVDSGFLRTERRRGRRYVRQTARYPQRWFDRLVGIENKPDLDRPGDLYSQLQTDVSLGIFDEVVLATADYVTGAHRNRIPQQVGIWRFDPDSGEREIVREATPLTPDSPGVEIIAERPGQTEVEIVDSTEKERARRRLAERAYGKGWRTFEWPACGRCDPEGDPADASVPYCQWAERVVDAVTTCGPDCSGFQAGEVPEVDEAAERAARSAWVADPDGGPRRQSGLDRFS